MPDFNNINVDLKDLLAKIGELGIHKDYLVARATELQAENEKLKAELASKAPETKEPTD